MSNKLQKRRPSPKATRPGKGLPASLTSGLRYEDIPMSPPDRLPSLGVSLSTQYSSTPNFAVIPKQPMLDSMPLASPSQYMRDSTASPTIDQARRNLDESTNKQRSRSMPPATSRVSSSALQGEHNTFRPQTLQSHSDQNGIFTPRAQSQPRQKCPENCQKCGKRKPELLETLQSGGSTMFPADAVRSSMAWSAQAPLQRPKACGQGCTSCTKCGKRNPPALQNFSGNKPYTGTTAPAAVPQAHLRSASEGAHQARTSPSSHLPPVGSPNPNAPPGTYKQCHTCGKPKRPASLPNPAKEPMNSESMVRQPENWPLPNSRLPSNSAVPRPFVLGAMSNPSTSTLAQSPFVANNEFSPLITTYSKAPDFDASRKAYNTPTYKRVRPPPNAGGSLIRRISNALRPAELLPATSPNRREKNRDQPYLRVAPTEVLDRPGSPFSFVESDFEMVPLAGAVRDNEKLFAPYSPSIYTVVPHTEVPEINITDTDTSAYARQNMANRNDSTMQRAVAGSIRRFKSLRGAHRGWYRDDMAIEGHYGYDAEPLNRVVDVY